jgi:hypothetical protein
MVCQAALRGTASNTLPFGDDTAPRALAKHRYHTRTVTAQRAEHDTQKPA